MKNRIILIIIGIVAYSCSNSSNKPGANDQKDQISENQLVINNDMEYAHEGVPSWDNEITVVRMDGNIKAHSGEYASKVDEENIYSYAFRETFENINEKLPKKIIVNGWVYATEPDDKLSFIMDINEDHETYIWGALSLDNLTSVKNQWTEFTAEFVINKPIKASHQLKLFGYGGKKVAYFDDIKVTFEY